MSKAARTNSSPAHFCSSECWLAFDYKSSLGLSIGLVSIGVIFSFVFFAIPSIFQSRFGLDTIILIVAGFGCGLPSLWCSTKNKTARREIPKDSRRGLRVDEPLEEYRDY